MKAWQHFVAWNLSDRFFVAGHITGTKEQEEKMMELMTLVGIQYLVDREGGWDTVRVWEDTLSLGE